MKNNIDSSNFGKINRRVRVDSKSGLFKSHGTISIKPFKSRKARFFSGFTTPEEGFVGQVYSFLDILKDLGMYIIKFRFLFFPVCEKFIKTIKRYGLFIGFPGCFFSSKGLIKDPSTALKLFIEGRDLRLFWIKSKFKGFTHGYIVRNYISTLLERIGLERFALIPRLKPWAFPLIRS